MTLFFKYPVDYGFSLELKFWKFFFSFFLVTSYWSKCLMFFRSSFSFDVYQMEGKGLSPCYLFHESGVLHHFFQKVRCSLSDNKKAPLVQMYHIFFALIKTILKKIFLFVFIFNRYKFCCADLPSAIVVHGRKVCFLVKLKIQMLSCEQSELTFQTGLIFFVLLNWLQKVNILQASLACEHAGFLNLIAVNWKNKKFSKCCSKFTSIKSFKIAKFKTMYKVTSLHRNVSIGKLNRIIHLHDSALEIRSDWKLVIRIKIYGSVYKSFYLQSLQILLCWFTICNSRSCTKSLFFLLFKCSKCYFASKANSLFTLVWFVLFHLTDYKK